jgi:uncharacterized membrane protein
MNWMYLILFSVILNSVLTIVQKKLITVSASPIVFGLFFQIAISILIAIFAIATGNLSFENTSNLLINFVILAFLYGLGSILYFLALKEIEASEFTILFSSRVVFSIIATSIILLEFLTTRQIFGTLLIIIAVIFVTIKSKNGFKFQFKKGEVYALLTALFYGFGIANHRIILQSVNVYTFLFIASLLPIIPFFIAGRGEIHQIKIFFTKKLFLKMLAMCIIHTLATLTFFASLQLAPNASQIVVISLSSVVLTVILAIFLLKERSDIKRKIISATLTLVGLVLMN